MSLPEAAEYLGLRQEQVERLVRIKTIDSIHLFGQLRVTQEELDRYIRENQTDADGRRVIMESGR